MKFRLSVQFPSKTDPIIKCFKHFQIFQISNFGKNHLIFEKSGISAKIGLFSIFFLSPHLYSMLRLMEQVVFLKNAFQPLEAPLLWIPSKRLLTRLDIELAKNLALSINCNVLDIFFVISSPFLSILVTFFLLEM